MHRTLLIAALMAAASVPAAALAQAPAGSAAERAAEAARVAAEAADRAAHAAREAANAAAAAAAAARDEPPQAPPGDPAPLNENLSVEGEAERLRADTARTRAATRAVIVEGVANGPNDRSLKANTAPELQLIASADEKIATLAWTLDVSGSPRPGKLSHTMFTLTASAGLDSEKNASILGLKGFPGGTEIKGSLIHYSAGFKPSKEHRPQVTRAREICREKAVREGKPNVDALCDPYEQEGGAGRFVADYNPGEYPSLLRDAMPGNVYFVGGEFSANQADFDYLDQPSFTMQSKSRFGYGGSIFGGLILPSGQTSIAASLTYARRYKAQDEITLCQPINAIPQTRCITAAGGPPSRKNQGIVSVEARHAFGASVGEFAKVALAPELSWDFNNDAYSLDLPIYLVGDGKGKLRGGVRFGYVNTEKEGGGREGDFSLGLFVGVPFTVFR